MGTLNFGRLTLPDYSDFRMISRGGAHIDQMTLWLRGATLQATKDLRTELRGHEGDYIAIDYDTDPDIDGFYYVDSVQIRSAARSASLSGNGLFRADIRLTFIGDYASTQIQSLLTQIAADEDHSVTESYWWAPAVGAKAVNAGSTTTTLVERTAVDGTIDMAYDISADINPTWSVDPANYYDGACYVYAGGVLRTGIEIPMDVTDWYIGNGLMEVRPTDYQSTSQGRIQVRFYDSTWGSWTDFQINNAGSNTLGSFDFVTVLVNQPELVVVRLIRDALEAPFATTALHQLDLTLRRGALFVNGLYSYTKVNGTHALEADTTDTATRPGGTGNYVTLDTLVSGDRIFYGMQHAYTLSGLEIQRNASASHMAFFIGAGINDNSTAGNQVSDLADQAAGMSPEVVRPVRR